NKSYTDDTHTGEITITAFDESSGRCTGTFWFDAFGPGGEQRVREGRFDVPIRRILRWKAMAGPTSSILPSCNPAILSSCHPSSDSAG
ncbi:MAG: hypothetical protein JXA28_10155, partial [Bacteroidetes bacterium]|nr:hypothetical protein [Bacteroidota bacterium]